jgi:hypothetical protein
MSLGSVEKIRSVTEDCVAMASTFFSPIASLSPADRRLPGKATRKLNYVRSRSIGSLNTNVKKYIWYRLFCIPYPFFSTEDILEITITSFIIYIYIDFRITVLLLF